MLGILIKRVYTLPNIQSVIPFINSVDEIKYRSIWIIYMCTLLLYKDKVHMKIEAHNR